MSNINFGAKLIDIQLAIAQGLHAPPFPLKPLTNFHVHLITKKGQRGHGHNGQAIVTFPNQEIAGLFMARFNRVLRIHGRIVFLSWKTGQVDAAKVEKVASSPYVDPVVEQKEKERRALDSTPIMLEKFCFGRFRRDGSFSGEAEGRGVVVFDFKARHIRVELPPESLYSLTQPTFHLVASQISAIAYAEGSLSVFVESLIPPSFQDRPHMDTIEAIMELLHKEPPSERRSSFQRGVVLPPVLHALRFFFTKRADSELFRERCKILHLPFPFVRDFVIHDRKLYGAAKMEELQSFMRTLDFEIAFEVDKAIRSGLLDADEALSLKPGLQVLKQRLHTIRAPEDEKRSFPSQIFIILERYLPPIGLLPIKRMPTRVETKRTRRRKKQQTRVVPPDTEDLSALLHHATSDFLEARISRRRFTPAPGIYSAFQIVITPTGERLEGPLPDQSNSVVRRYGNHSRFLKVSFQDENGGKLRRDPGVSIDALLMDRYRPIFTGGVRVAGRKHEFLGYSMSGLKDYLFMFVRPFIYKDPELGRSLILDAKTIRGRLVGLLRDFRISFYTYMHFRVTLRKLLTNQPCWQRAGVRHFLAQILPSPLKSRRSFLLMTGSLRPFPSRALRTAAEPSPQRYLPKSGNSSNALGDYIPLPFRSVAVAPREFLWRILASRATLSAFDLRNESTSLTEGLLTLLPPLLVPSPCISTAHSSPFLNTMESARMYLSGIKTTRYERRDGRKNLFLSLRIFSRVMDWVLLSAFQLSSAISFTFWTWTAIHHRMGFGTTSSTPA